MRQSSNGRFGFFLVLVFLLFEYGRPQDHFSVVGMMRPGLIIGLLMVVAWLQHGNLRQAASPQFLYVILMLFVLALHVPFATNNYWAYQQTLAYFLLLPFFISMVLFVDNFERLRSFMKWWSILAAYIAINGVLGVGIAGSAFLNDENDFSLLMNVMLPFVLCLSIYERKGFRKLALVAVALLCVASIVISNSRGGFVGLIAVLAVFWIVSPRKLVSLLLMGVLAASVYILASDKYWDRISTIEKTTEGTAKERLDSWQAGWDMFKDNPMGVGPGNFPIRFPEYQLESMQRNMWGRQAHSLWFTLVSELGIPGIILYFLLLKANLRDILFLRKLPRNDDQQRFGYLLSIAFLASLAGYLASATFLSVLYYPHFWYLTAMIVATRNVMGNLTSEGMVAQTGRLRPGEGR